jgi:hypothetical protein
MKKIVFALLGCALIFALSGPVVAHNPPDYLGLSWQWPADKMPVRDGNLSDWDIVPDEFWQTHENWNVQSCIGSGYDEVPELDPSSYSFRWTMAFVNGSSRTQWAYEVFDDQWDEWDQIEASIDADHSGGNFHSAAGMTEEEAARNKNRQAQIYHIWFDDGAHLGGDQWMWAWNTAADWYQGGTPYSDAAMRHTVGTPLSGGERNSQVEFSFTAWDDLLWDNPNDSVEHLLTEGETIGLNLNLYDREGEGDARYQVRWTISPECSSFGNSDFFADFLLVEVDEELMATAVAEDSWGNIKASLAK